MKPRYEPSKARPTFPAAYLPRYADTTGLGVARYPTVDVDDACVFVELDPGGIE